MRLCTTVLVLTCFLTVRAQSGVLDPSFNGSGYATLAIGPHIDEGAMDVALQTDGKIVVVGTYQPDFSLDVNILLARFNADGSPDPSFGTGGFTGTSLGSGSDQGASLIIQPDGKIVVGGTRDAAGVPQFAVLRYLPDGTLDPAFGIGGIVETDVPGGLGRAYSVDLQADGKIVLAGFIQIGGNPADFAVLRYLSDGTPDVTFDGDGLASLSFTASHDVAYDMLIEPDGAILLGGSSGNHADLAMARFLPDGSLDPLFGIGGQVSTSLYGVSDFESGNALAVQPDGKILLGGTTQMGFAQALVRYFPDGTIDSAFGVGGSVIRAVTTGNSCSASEGCSAVLVQPDGRILMGGNGTTDTTYNMILMRYDANGLADPGFGTTGAVQVTLGAAGNDGIAAILLQPDGKILTAGLSWSAADDMDLLVARYLNDGSSGISTRAERKNHISVAPNPALGSALIEYELANARSATLILRDLHGRVARTFHVQGSMSSGPQRETIDLSGLSAGVYALTLSSGIDQATTRLVVQ